MRQYDAAIEEYCPARGYFFSNSRGMPYTAPWLSMKFRELWDGVSQSYARAYDLRHHYATVNINKWLDTGYEFLISLLIWGKAWGTVLWRALPIITRSSHPWPLCYPKSPKPVLMISYRRCAMKKISTESTQIALHISVFLNEYAANYKTSSGHTLKSYHDTLTLYLGFWKRKKVSVLPDWAAAVSNVLP